MQYLEDFYPGHKEGLKLRLRTLEGGGVLSHGNVFYVNSATGSDSAKSGTSPTEALATIDAAIGKCTASNGDVIFVMPGHSETVTSAITADVAGISIIGLGVGNQRPTITGNGTIDAMTLTAAGVLVENLRFAAPGTDNQTADINVAAAGCVIRNTYHIGSTTAKNKTDIITVASGGDDLIVEGVRAYNSVVDCVSWLSLEAAVARAVIRNNFVYGQFSTAVLMDEAAATACFIRANVFGQTKAAVATVDFTNNSTGVCSFNHLGGRNTTLASNLVAGNAMDFFENRVTEEAALNGAVIPAADTD